MSRGLVTEVRMSDQYQNEENLELLDAMEIGIDLSKYQIPQDDVIEDSYWY